MSSETNGVGDTMDASNASRNEREEAKVAKALAAEKEYRGIRALGGASCAALNLKIDTLSRLLEQGMVSTRDSEEFIRDLERTVDSSMQVLQQDLMDARIRAARSDERVIDLEEKVLLARDAFVELAARVASIEATAAAAPDTQHENLSGIAGSGQKWETASSGGASVATERVPFIAPPVPLDKTAATHPDPTLSGTTAEMKQMCSLPTTIVVLVVEPNTMAKLLTSRVLAILQACLEKLASSGRHFSSAAVLTRFAPGAMEVLKLTSASTTVEIITVLQEHLATHGGSLEGNLGQLPQLTFASPENPAHMQVDTIAWLKKADDLVAQSSINSKEDISAPRIVMAALMNRVPEILATKVMDTMGTAQIAS